MKQDIFKSVPAEGAVVNDWTKAILMVDVKNSAGEKYHFEIPPIQPGQTINLPPKYGDTSWGGKCQLDIILPICR